MAFLKINWNDPLMKALKAVNSLAGNGLIEDDLERHRAALELAGRLAAPSREVTVATFKIQNLDCEWVHLNQEPKKNPVILYAHGGGYVCGALDYARILAAKLAIATGYSVLSFAYRLAPEFPYPAAIEDGMAVWNYLMEKGYSPSEVILAGDSAGGNLVLCLTQKLLEEEKQKPGLLLLFSPWTDMTASSDSYEKYKKKDPILTREYILGVRAAYLYGKNDGGTTKGIVPSDSKVSPLYGKFYNFPKTFIMVGKNEILLNDSKELYKKIQKAGGKAVLDVEEHGWHVYQQMPLPIARRGMKRLADFVKKEEKRSCSSKKMRIEGKRENGPRELV